MLRWLGGRSSSYYFIYINEYSCYKTICQRHRTTIPKLLTKYDHPPKVCIPTPCNITQLKVVSLFTTKYYLVLSKYQLKSAPIWIKIWGSRLKWYNFQWLPNNANVYYDTQLKLNLKSKMCHIRISKLTDTLYYLHYIRYIREYWNTTRRGFDRIHTLLKIKQIPVYEKHHRGSHDGIYDSIPLSDLYDSRVEQLPPD